MSASAPRPHGYRSDIDGLRSLAVVPVVLFHAGVSALKGGFVGVDVFFVISGYLITGILYREAMAGKLSILKFYERRVRRIMPNLLALLLATTLACGVILIPVDLSFFSKSIVATLMFGANIYFYYSMGYFAPTSLQLPLLHMWSLGVEEQYYLFFPLALMVLVRLRRGWFLGGIWLIFAASFALGTWMVNTAPDAAFYLPLARLWELTTGSLLAVGAVPRIGSRALREIVAGAGLCAIVAAMATYDSFTVFPGPAALAPCIGAAALIHANTSDTQTLTGRLLSWRPLVFIGLASYSIYIWHWPVIVLTRYVLQRELQPGEIAIMLAAIFLLAIAAWQWIEKPMRSRSVSTLRLLSICGGATLLLLALAGGMYLTRGLPQRYDIATRKLALAASDINPARALCDHPSASRLANGDVCHIGPPGAARFAMIGDSFGDALSPAFARAAEVSAVPGIAVTFSGCAPLPDVDEKAGRCRQVVQSAYALLAREPSLQRVILVGRWPTMVTGQRDGLFHQNHIWVLDSLSRRADAAENRQVMARGFARAAASIGKAELVVVTGIPEQHVDVPQATTLARLFGGGTSGLPRADLNARQASTLAVLDAADHLAGHKLRRLSLTDAMCTPTLCPIVSGNTALYADDNHPSRSFALSLAPAVQPVLGDLSP